MVLLSHFFILSLTYSTLNIDNNNNNTTSKSPTTLNKQPDLANDHPSIQPNERTDSYMLRIKAIEAVLMPHTSISTTPKTHPLAAECDAMKRESEYENKNRKKSLPLTIKNSLLLEH